MNPARLLFPALRADSADFDSLLDDGLRYVEAGVGGVILFGGRAEEIRRLVDRLRDAAPHPILVGSDLERGCGQQFSGATRLPPPAALAHLRDHEAVRSAGELTGREAMALGVDWVFAPVADLDLEPRNPIVGTRSFGADPELVAERIAAWIDGCRSSGAAACAKHFPGHGRTVGDSHVSLPVVDASASELETDLAPFRGAIEAGVESVMLAHVRYPAFDPGPGPTMGSRRIVTDLLRDRLCFDGVVVTDALIMEGAGDGAKPLVDAVVAGVDALLYPHDVEGAIRAIEQGLDRRAIPEARLLDAIERIEGLAGRTHAPRPRTEVGLSDDLRDAASLALRSLDWIAGTGGWPVTPTELEDGALHSLELRPGAFAGSGVVELLVLDDDLGGPYPPPSRDVLLERLAAGGIQVLRDLDRWDDGSGPATRPRPPLLVALFSEPRGWKGRAALGEEVLGRLGSAVGAARGAGRPVAVLLFGHPRLAAEVPSGVPTLLCWGGEANMQEAAAIHLAGEIARPDADAG